LGGFTDGKTENVEWKTGEVKINAPSGQYTTKNIGKTDVELYVVVLKRTGLRARSVRNCDGPLTWRRDDRN
jgi:hypothetical protein